jgi:hypothetical protein
MKIIRYSSLLIKAEVCLARNVIKDGCTIQIPPQKRRPKINPVLRLAE